MIAVDRLLDTNFLILRWRDGRNSPAAQWLRDNADLALGLPWIVKGEFLRGAAVAGHQPDAVRTFLDRFPAIWPDNTTLEIYASQFARLRAANSLPRPHDLWIAATALPSTIDVQWKVPGRKSGMKPLLMFWKLLSNGPTNCPACGPMA
jgi:predicted nucleic acid-binding protein